jgi:ketosteroid isomerase-like protein
MSEHPEAANKQLVVSYLRARQQGDLDTYAGYMTDDIVRYPPRPSLRDRVFRGKAEVVAGVRIDLFEPGTLAMEVERVVAEGELVAVQFVLRGTTTRHQDFETYQHFLFECRDGKVAAEWEYLDTLYASRMLGSPDELTGGGA